ncbi:LysM domain-containing protein [Bernardetia sp. ABR2-2B]|uniref:LysM domain-containing protein n=1 Tax=Bernardetia sp. ABR2-2B TaxID=3127472 RepID=UPI0030D386BC
MKSFILSVLFFTFLQTSFAQKYEYNIIGEHFSDTLYSNRVISIREVNTATTTDRKAVFERPKDTTYIYHLVGEGENVEYILNLYQTCAPCFSKWNDVEYTEFSTFLKQPFYEGEYLKVALKKEYQNGTAAEFRKRTIYKTFKKQTYLSTIARDYRVTKDELIKWNNLHDGVYMVESTKLIVGEMEYKYTCSCLE